MRSNQSLPIAVFTFLLILFLAPVSLQAGNAPLNYDQIMEKQEKSSFAKKVKDMTGRQKAKLDRKMKRINKKLEKKNAAPDLDEGVRTGLVIVGVGAIIALLGLTGIADILITIGLVVLILGLLFWLLGV